MTHVYARALLRLDISQRKQVESLQEKRVLEAEEHKRAQDAFIDMTSHEVCGLPAQHSLTDFYA